MSGQAVLRHARRLVINEGDILGKAACHDQELARGMRAEPAHTAAGQLQECRADVRKAEGVSGGSLPGQRAQAPARPSPAARQAPSPEVGGP
jgi:hypothetical protein